MSEILTAVSAPIGNVNLLAGGAAEGFVTLAGATVGMVVVVTPTTYPGDDIIWQGVVTAANTITIKVTKILSGWLPAATYNVQVASGSGTGTLVGGVNAQTADYLAVAADTGKLISFSGSSALTLTLPATPPSTSWCVFVQNATTASLTVSPNGLNIDGSSSSLTLLPNEGVYLTTDGTNYFTERGVSNTTVFRLTGQTGSISTTTFFTAPIAGVYEICPALHWTAYTTGSIASISSYTNSVGVSTALGGASSTGGADSNSTPRQVVLQAGAVCTFSATATAVTGIFDYLWTVRLVTSQD